MEINILWLWMFLEISSFIYDSLQYTVLMYSTDNRILGLKQTGEYNEG